jgi:hypothetical protein
MRLAIGNRPVTYAGGVFRFAILVFDVFSPSIFRFAIVEQCSSLACANDQSIQWRPADFIICLLFDRIDDTTNEPPHPGHCARCGYID